MERLLLRRRIPICWNYDAKLGVVENDIAIVFDATHPYVIAVLSNDVKSNADAQNTIAKISKDVYEFMTSQK